MTEASDVPFGLEVTKGVVAKFLLAAIGFAGTIAFARILGPVAFGGFYLVWSLVQIAKLPVEGFSQAGKKRYSESNSDRQEITGATVIAVLGIVGVAIFVALLLKDSMAGFTGLKNSHILFILLVVAHVIFTPFQGLLSATGRVSLTIWIDFLRSLITTPLQLVFVLAGYGAAGMAYGLTIATVMTAAVTQYSLRTKPVIPSGNTLRRLWAFGRHSTISSVLGTAFSRLDVILLGIVLSPAAVGNYEVAYKLSLPAILLAEVAGDGLMPRVSNLDSKGESIIDDLTHTISLSSFLALPIFLGSLVLSQPIVVTIYGPDYAAAASLLVGLSLFRLLQTQTMPLMATVMGLDHPEVNVRISGLTVGVNLVLGVILTLEYGSIGVVVATVAAEAIRYLALVSVVSRWVPASSLVPNTLLEQGASGFLMAIVVFAVESVVPIRSWLDLSFVVGIGAVIYVATTILISETLRTTILGILRDANLILERQT